MSRDSNQSKSELKIPGLTFPALYPAAPPSQAEQWLIHRGHAFRLDPTDIHE